jgi:hypothetical protein
MEASTGDLALGLARVEGKLDALNQTTTLQLGQFRETLSESQQDRRDLHRENDALAERINKLENWRSWVTGGLAGLGVLSLYLVAHSQGWHL